MTENLLPPEELNEENQSLKPEGKMPAEKVEDTHETEEPNEDDALPDEATQDGDASPDEATQDGDALPDEATQDGDASQEKMISEADAVSMDEETKQVEAQKEESETGVTGDDLPPLGVDYSESSKEEMVEALQKLLERRPIQEIRTEVENIKSAFYKRHNLKIEEKKTAFLSEGGKEEEFQLPPDPLEEQYKELYSSYRQRKIEYNKVLEQQKVENLALKREIINKIKNLIHSQESLNKTFNDFRDLQNDWRAVGPVPQKDLASLWENYHHHVENFYDFIKINKELRDLDLKKNLESKVKLCEKAESLMLEPNVLLAFKSLQELHNQWREIGPVPRENKEELWERFKEATSHINKKHQDHFKGLKDQQKDNLIAKEQLCEEVEQINSQEIKSPREWNKLSQKVVKIQKMWRTIGFAPKKDNNAIYERFRGACDVFFNNKREFFAKHREKQNQNLQLKTELCIQAEGLAESTDWKETTDELIRIQKRWKEIGPVPKKYSDSLWMRFRTACDTFFESKKKHFHGQNSELIENLKLKRELIVEVKGFELTGDSKKDLNSLKFFQKKFLEIGGVPPGDRDPVQKEFRSVINEHFDKLNIDESNKEELRFRQKIELLAQSSKNRSRLRAERDRLVSKLKQLESDIVLWENNIGFFAKSKNTDAMVANVKKNIEQGREQMQTLKEKIDIIDQAENQTL